jgi:hypothetical protein
MNSLLSKLRLIGGSRKREVPTPILGKDFEVVPHESERPILFPFPPAALKWPSTQTLLTVNTHRPCPQVSTWHDI